MSEAKATQQEPSMEEILASIRRIISEDTDAGKQPAPAAEAPPPEKPAAKAEVLELTEMVEEDGSVVNLRTAAAKVKPVVPEPAPIVPPPPPPSAPVEAADPAPVLPMPSEDSLISSATAAAATSALSSLKASNKDMEPRTPPMPLGSNVTLEDLVRQELKPILKDWLDQNLKGIVERLVDREVRRLSRQADAD